MGRLAVKTKSDGTVVVQTRCPFHDDRQPSLSVLFWTHRGSLRCYVRCWAGCYIDPVRKQQVIDLVLENQAVRDHLEKVTNGWQDIQTVTDTFDSIDTDKSDLDLHEYGEQLNEKQKTLVLKEFVKSRGIHPEVAKACGLKVIEHTDNQYLFPGEVGLLIPMVSIYQNDSYQIRLLRKTQSRPKYLTKPQTVCTLFQVMVNAGKEIVFCESPIKAMSLASKLFELKLDHHYSVVYSTGTGNCTSQKTLSELVQLYQQTRSSKIILWFDVDTPGEQAMSKVAQHLSQCNVRHTTVDANYVRETIQTSKVQTGLGIDDYFNALLSNQVLTKQNVIPVKVSINIRRVCDIPQKPLQFLMYPFVPLQGLTIIEGDPGCGKSFFTLGLACACCLDKPITLGDTQIKLNQSGPAIVFSCEDADHVILSRIQQICNGHVPDNLYVVTDLFDLSSSTSDIESLIETYQPKLIVFDPIMSYMGNKIDVYRDSSVRSVLEPLNKLSSKYDLAVVIVRHLRKKHEGEQGVYHGIGSIAFSALARSVVLVNKVSFGVSSIELVKSSYCDVTNTAPIEYKIRNLKVE